MRTFVAIDIPPAIRRNIARLMELLRPASTRVRWVRPESLHVTLKFIGELSAQALPDVERRLAAMDAPGPVSLEVRGADFFPNERAPRVIWLGLESGPELAALAAQVDEALLQLGIPKESRPFAPHLTLGRFKSPARIPAVQEILRKQEPLEFGSFVAKEFCVFESHLSPGGSVYRKIARFALVANSA